MPDLAAFFRTAPVSEFSGVVCRVAPARYAGNIVSMRGAFLHGARYNVSGYFGALYTSLSVETARHELGRYFTVPPIGGFVEASIRLRLTRVVDLTNGRLLRRAGIRRDQLIQLQHTIPQAIGLRAWENGIEGLLAPSAADPAETNLAVFLDNQQPSWAVQLTTIAPSDLSGHS